MGKIQEELKHNPSAENKTGMSRRQFIKTTGAAMAMGMIAGMGVYGKPLFAAEFDEYIKYDGIGLADLVRRKQVKPEELLESMISRIEAINPKINAVVTKMYDEAKAAIANGLPDGPFKGVPFLLKDLGAPYSGVRLTFGSKLYENYVPNYDNELVKRYKKSGLVIAGRTNTPEFGLVPTTESVLLGPAHNPWNLDYATGGSSGGSAAAVATRIVPVAHGGDGGGSIRIPSSCCGIFGLKPTRGRIPTGPEFGEMWEGFATNHVLSMSVRDNAAMLDVSSAPDIGAPYGIPAPKRPFLKEVGKDPGKLKIAVFTNNDDIKAHPDCIKAVKDAAELCVKLGHEVEETFPKINVEQFSNAFKIVVGGHTAATLDRIGKIRGKKITADMVEPFTWEFAQVGWKHSAGDFAGTKAVINATTRSVGQFLTRYDAILTPTLGTPPPKLGHLDTVNLSFDELIKRINEFMTFTPIFNMTGLPAMSVPLYWNGEGLPIGVQFAFPYADEATLFRLAGQLENERPWKNRIPKIANI